MMLYLEGEDYPQEDLLNGIRAGVRSLDCALLSAARPLPASGLNCFLKILSVLCRLL